MPKKTKQQLLQESRVRMSAFSLELSKLVYEHESKLGLSVDEISKVLIDKASRILEDGIRLENGIKE